MSIDLTALLPALTKTGAAGVVLAILIGTAQVVTAWRGGNLSKAKEGDLVQQIQELKEEVNSHAQRLAAQELRIADLTEQVHSTRYQRDQARLYAEFLEMRYQHSPIKTWDWAVGASLAAPAAPATAIAYGRPTSTPTAQDMPPVAEGDFPEEGPLPDITEEP